MKILIFSFALITSFALNSQSPQKPKKGRLYVYWGWNRDHYTRSNIHFKGENYDFTIQKVVANDRQSRFNAGLYLNPKTMSIPQYNLRIGYFISDKYNISIGADHMKYVMQNGLSAKIVGSISQTGTKYDGTYAGEEIELAKDFILFEHTDGLNYENIEVRRFDNILHTKYINIALNEGIGLGVLVPRTNCTLLNNERYDEFHLAGYGLAAVASLNIEFFNHFFIQAEYKGGFINMPDIRTTKFSADRASQHFFFSQYNCVFGVIFNLFPKKENQIPQP